MNTGDFFSRFLFYSLLVHLVVIVYVVLDPLSGIFSKKDMHIKNAIRVDAIGLPELQQKHSAKPAPQKSKLEVKDKKVKKPPKPVKPVAQKKKAVKKKPPAKQVKLKKAKPKAKPKAKKKEKPVDKVREEQNQAMEKIRDLKKIEQGQNQAIEKLETMESIEKIKQEVETAKYTGAKISKGNARDGEEKTDFEMLKYFTSVRAHINMYWSLPQELANRNLRAKIYTEINNEGVVLKGKIMQSSGNEDFDARVLNTIEKSFPFAKASDKRD